MLDRLFGSGSRRAPESEVWRKLVAESGAGIRQAGDTITDLIDRAGGLSAAIPETKFLPQEADRPFEEIISGVESELETLCVRYDYRQLLFLSRLCTGVPLLRDADADMEAVRVRVQNADRWVLRCGSGSLARDFVRIEDGGLSIGILPESIFRDAIKLHWFANFHQWRVIDRAMFNFTRLVSQENGLSAPRLRLLSGGGVGREWGAPETWASVNLYAHRYNSQNSDLAWWAMWDAEPDGEPYTLMYGYSPEITNGSYGGGELFVPVPLWLGAMTEYGKRFRPLFEREDAVGMPPEHLRAISRGLARLVMDAVEDPELTPWVAVTGTLAVPRDSLLGTPLKEAARGYLADADPDRADDTDLEQSVDHFVALASSSPDAVPGHHRPSSRDSSVPDAAPEQGRGRDAASARTLGYPYMIHGGPEHELWLVDYLNTLPFFQSLAGEMRFSRAKHAFARTSMFDSLLAEVMEGVPEIEPAFVDYREASDLPNAKFYFDSGKDREIDVPLRRGRVLIAVQTWARNLNFGVSEGEYRAMRRRWEAAKEKLCSTDKKYTDYLLQHPEGKGRMAEEGLYYILPVLCGPFTEPVASLDPKFWLRPLSTSSYEEAVESLPRILSPAELERFLSTATEQELTEICTRNEWVLRN